MYILGVALASAIVGVLILLAVEARKWAAGRLFISRRRFALRIAAGLILAALLAGVFVGLLILRLAEPTGRPLLFLGYWLGCLVIALGLIVVALAEMKQVRLGEKAGESANWREIARLLADHSQRKKD